MVVHGVIVKLWVTPSSEVGRTLTVRWGAGSILCTAYSSDGRNHHHQWWSTMKMVLGKVPPKRNSMTQSGITKHQTGGTGYAVRSAYSINRGHHHHHIYVKGIYVLERCPPGVWAMIISIKYHALGKSSNKSDRSLRTRSAYSINPGHHHHHK